jgi:hypothetical protein
MGSLKMAGDLQSTWASPHWVPFSDLVSVQRALSFPATALDFGTAQSPDTGNARPGLYSYALPSAARVPSRHGVIGIVKIGHVYAAAIRRFRKDRQKC